MEKENIYADIERYQKYCAEHNLKINDASNLKAFMQNDLPLFYYEKIAEGLKGFKNDISIYKNLFICYAIIEKEKVSYNYNLICNILNDLTTLIGFVDFMAFKTSNSISERKQHLKTMSDVKGGKNE